ncbi:hypothetical protein [Kocuria sp.]|uniref:hypothetical protein n=1 Tax=Kocuria sp. TaxID=1871328 RepID=UPI00289FE788|nr:hypothetical protein [Kocuria sp.]
MNQLAPVPQPLVIYPDDAAGYLERMGLRIAQINAAITTGENASGNTSRYAPVIAAGINRWTNTVAMLRQRLCEDGDWTYMDPQNRPIATDQTGKYQVSVAGGNNATGVPDPLVVPQAARRKGGATADSVDRNQQVLFGLGDLLEIDQPLSSNAQPPSGAWVLLYHRAEGEIRCELSRPSGFDRQLGQFTGWDVRVILAPLQDETVLEPNITDIGGGDVDFNIA